MFSTLLQSACFFVFFILTHSQYHYTRVLNGSPVLIQEYPIIAQMLLDAWDNQQYVQYCAGVILTSRHVISTAHCFEYSEDLQRNTEPQMVGNAWTSHPALAIKMSLNLVLNRSCSLVTLMTAFSLPQYWKIRVGSSYRSHGGMLHKVKKIIKHYGFDKYYYMNDIAVVIVSKKITFSKYVGQATIIKDGTELPENSVCTLIGWGTTYKDGPQPDQLQSTNMLTINSEQCKMMYSTIGAVITSSMLCAGRNDIDGVDACFGDSGGPLIYKGVVIGLVSFGYSCGLRYYPGVYTKISHYTDWIVKTITTNK